MKAAARSFVKITLTTLIVTIVCGGLANMLFA
jgi:hypothetical protein